MPQGSVLRPTLFLLVCNDLLEIIEDCDGEIHIYADDTTIYVAASSPDMGCSCLERPVSKVIWLILLELPHTPPR